MTRAQLIAEQRQALADMYARNGLPSWAQAVRDQGPTPGEVDPELTLIKLPFNL